MAPPVYIPTNIILYNPLKISSEGLAKMNIPGYIVPLKNPTLQDIPLQVISLQIPLVTEREISEENGYSILMPSSERAEQPELGIETMFRQAQGG